MQQILRSVLLLFIAFRASAQAPAVPDSAREAANLLAAKYHLTTEQTEQMYGIQARKQRNLAAIQAIQTDNPTLYRVKLRSIQDGTQASIGRMLNTPEQRQAFEQTQAEQRRLRSQKIEALSAEGASQEAIQDATLAIYLE